MEAIHLNCKKNEKIANEDEEVRFKSKKCGYPFRKYIREYNEVTGIHGLRYLTEKRSRTEKIIWVISLLISAAGCMYMILEIWKKYQNSPVVVSYSSKFTPIFKIPFPAVTICPQSKCSKMKFNMAEVIAKNTRNETLTDTEWKHLIYMDILCGRKGSGFSNEKFLDQDFYEIINELKPTFFISVFPYIQWMNVDLSFSDEFVPIITDMGVCYSFNIFTRSDMFRENTFHFRDFHQHNYSIENFDGEVGYKDNMDIDSFPYRALLSGADQSLTIPLFHFNSNVDYACSFIQGFRFQVHSPWVFPRLSKKFFYVPLDRSVIASIRPKLLTTSEAVKKFSPSRRQCYFRNERPLKFFKIYTQSNCLLECETNTTLQKCGCVTFHLPHDNDTKICESGSQDCTMRAERSTWLWDIADKIELLPDNVPLCDCKPTCSDLSYSSEISQTELNIENLQRLNLTELDSVPQGHISILQIYFESPQFLALERNELYGISDFISNFGGILGLFTGFSLLTIVEIFYFLTLRIYCNARLYGRWSGEEA